jgi:hypothetical protein
MNSFYESFSTAWQDLTLPSLVEKIAWKHGVLPHEVFLKPNFELAFFSFCSVL